jgi:CHRD domain
MKHLPVVAALLGLFAAGCGSSTAPSPVNPTFTMQLSPAVETPPITSGPESVVSGSATITFVTTKDAAGNITGGTGTAVVNLTGFPAGSTIIASHIHAGGPGVKGAVLIPFPPPAVTLSGGSGTYTATGNADATQMANILANPGQFYFNVHSALNPGGVIRSQLIRTQ